MRDFREISKYYKSSIPVLFRKGRDFFCKKSRLSDLPTTKNKTQQKSKRELRSPGDIMSQT